MRLAALALCGWAVAAGASAQGREYGVKGGVNLSTFNSDADGESVSYDAALPGVAVGGFVIWPVASRLAFAPEVLFSQKGGKTEVAGGKLTQRIDYLEVPLLASYRLFGAAARSVSIVGGASFGVRLGANTRATYGSSTVETDIQDEVKSTDAGIVAGAAYRRGRLIVDGRYTFGLVDVDKQTDDSVMVKNRALTFLAGWKF